MNRVLVCAVLIASVMLYAVWQSNQNLKLHVQLEKERKELEQAQANARQKAIDALQSMQSIYEKRLRQQAKARALIEQERAEALTQIEEGKTDGPKDYQSWAVQPLPDIVVKRLQQLPKERATTTRTGD